MKNKLNKKERLQKMAEIKNNSAVEELLKITNEKLNKDQNESDDNFASDSYIDKFTDTLIDSIKIEGLDD